MINFELQENKYPTLIYCDICKCLMPINHNHEYYFSEASPVIQYYWHCGLCGGYHSMEDGCPLDRTADDNNICPIYPNM